MPNIVYSTDSTTLVLNGHVFTSFIVGDFIEVAPVGEASGRVNSSDGVSITKRADYDVHDLTVRVQAYSEDDIFLNSTLAGVMPTMFAGSLKQAFVANGVESIDTWTFEGGSIITRPTKTINNQEGNVQMEYKIQFRFASRVI